MKIRIALAMLLFVMHVLARTAGEQGRIDYLINSLGQLHNAVFIRNGTEYNSGAAQNHLRQKLRVAGERIQTAEQFIQYCASESSMSHKPYQIRFADGKSQNTADYFGGKLREYDQAQRR